MKKILIVDDEEHIVEFLQINLEKQGYDTITASNGDMAIQKAHAYIPDCILLDIMMPVINGYEVCRRLKADPKTQNIPIIMLTAKSDEADSILGLGIGADDYIVKPFSIKVLFARIEAVMRRYNIEKDSSPLIKLDSLTINPYTYQVKKDEKLIHLTPNEYDILLALANNKNILVSRHTLNESLEIADDPSSRALDVHISSLRKKIESASIKIINIRGKGYMLNV